MAEIKGKIFGCIEEADLIVDPVWDKIRSQLSKTKTPLKPEEVDYLHIYYIEEKYLVTGNSARSREIYKCVDEVYGTTFSDFEDTHASLFAAIDVALKGASNWDAEPAFKISR